MPSRQETFETVVKHLIRQGKKAEVVGSLSCRYRTPDGLKCAAGCLIPDSEYSPSFEGQIVGGIIDGSLQRMNSLSLLLVRLGHDIRFVRRLQVIHDFYEPNQWPERLRYLGQELDLDTSCVRFK